MLKNTRRVMRRVRGLVMKLEEVCWHSDGTWKYVFEADRWREHLEVVLKAELERLGRKAGEE